MKTTALIFLSYARADIKEVEKLYKDLADARFKPWMDIKDILPGQDWKHIIKGVIQKSDFFLACLLTNSVNKRGFFQTELKDGMEVLKEKLKSDIYLIPVRLEECDLPEDLNHIHRVDLFAEDGWEKLVSAIQVEIRRRNREKRASRYESKSQRSDRSLMNVRAPLKTSLGKQHLAKLFGKSTAMLCAKIVELLNLGSFIDLNIDLILVRLEECDEKAESMAAKSDMFFFSLSSFVVNSIIQVGSYPKALDKAIKWVATQREDPERKYSIDTLSRLILTYVVAKGWDKHKDDEDQMKQDTWKRIVKRTQDLNS